MSIARSRFPDTAEALSNPLRPSLALEADQQKVLRTFCKAEISYGVRLACSPASPHRQRAKARAGEAGLCTDRKVGKGLVDRPYPLSYKPRSQAWIQPAPDGVGD